MKNIIKKSLQGLLIVPALAIGVVLAGGALGVPVANAQGCDVGGGIAGGAGCAQGKDQQSDLFGETGIFKTITNVLLFVIGAISVIMLIIGGIRYTTSNGDTGAVTTAKNTILYAVIGIVIALLAYALVNFVITSLVKT
jgi:hypothetical protein